ncbi:MAG: PDZ domain-containing protein [Nitrospinota bacterium]
MLGISMEKSDVGGVKISSVVPGSPAEKGGIIAGDIIVGMDGAEVKEFFDITYNVRNHEPKEKGVVEVLRDGTRVKLDIVYDVLKPHKPK